MFVPGSKGFIALLGAFTALTALSIDISLPALPHLTAVFETTVDRTQLTLSVFLLGFAVSQLFYGPLSDRFGRKPVLLVGLGIYALGGLGCAVSVTIEQLIAFRFVQGLGASVGRVLGPAIVRDEFQQPRSSQMLSYITTVMGLAPLLAPILGGYLLILFDWHAIFLALGIAGLAVLAATALRFGETIKARDPTATSASTLLRNYIAFATNPSCVGYAIVNCCLFGGMFSYISSSSFVIIEVYGIGNPLYGYLFGVTALAFMAGALTNGRLVRRVAPQHLLAAGQILVSTAGAMLFVLTFFGIAGVAGVVLPMMVFIYAAGIVGPNATAAAMQPLPRMAGVASSLLGCSQAIAGSLAAYLVGYFYDHTALSMSLGVAILGISSGLVSLWVVNRTKSASPSSTAPS